MLNDFPSRRNAFDTGSLKSLIAESIKFDFFIKWFNVYSRINKTSRNLLQSD